MDKNRMKKRKLKEDGEFEALPWEEDLERVDPE